jgi:hypothetical protein
MNKDALKLTFEVENLEEIDMSEGSSFAKMKMDFFASGNNSHNLYISEETLKKTAETIYNVPVVWKYNEKEDEILGHEIDEVPCGFVPEKTPIHSKRLPDGRLMLSTVATIWKKYSGRLIEIFKRDKKKGVSVEMSVLDIEENENGKELKDYRFEAITLLGRRRGVDILPAIPLANAEMMSFTFSDEDRIAFQKDFEKEFGSSRYRDVDFRIPESVKEIAKSGLSKYSKKGRGGNTLILSIAKHLSTLESAEPKKVRRMFKQLSSMVNGEIGEDDVVKYEMCGGKEGFEWSKILCEKMDEIDKKRNSYFSDTSESLEEQRGKEEEQQMTKKEEKKFEEQEEEKKDAQMAADEAKEGESADEKPEEKPEEKEESSEEKMEEKVEKMSLDSYVDQVYMLKLLEEITEEEKSEISEDEFSQVKMAADEIKKEGEKDFGVIMKGMGCRMSQMAKSFAKMLEAQKVYLAENEELKKFKSSVEEAKFSFEVENTLNEISTYVPKEEIEKAKEESKNFSLENIDAWKNSVKAMAFTFSKSKDEKEEKKPERWNYSFETKTTKDELWVINK